MQICKFHFDPFHETAHPTDFICYITLCNIRLILLFSSSSLNVIKSTQSEVAVTFDLREPKQGMTSLQSYLQRKVTRCRAAAGSHFSLLGSESEKWVSSRDPQSAAGTCVETCDDDGW